MVRVYGEKFLSSNVLCWVCVVDIYAWLQCPLPVIFLYMHRTLCSWQCDSPTQGTLGKNIWQFGTHSFEICWIVVVAAFNRLIQFYSVLFSLSNTGWYGIRWAVIFCYILVSVSSYIKTLLLHYINAIE